VAQSLADYKVPVRIVFVNSLPVSAGGKIRRIGLADQLGLAPREQTLTSRAAFVAPKTESEILVAAILRELLQVSDIGVNDAFDALGGNSLTALWLSRAFTRRRRFV